jgi:S-adenosylmethionine synthetase
LKGLQLHEYLFTSESVSEGHPDKICDTISDALLDFYLRQDERAKVAIEALATTNQVVLAGEVNSSYVMTSQEADSLVRSVIRDIGYEQKGFHYKNVSIDNFIHSQSADIRQGVDKDDGSVGAGDQGIMFGYATAEAQDTEFMPAAVFYANKLLVNLKNERAEFPFLRPDAKAQVTLVYRDGKPYRADSVVLSTQHSEEATLDDVKQAALQVIEQTLPHGWLPSSDRIFINPTGRFVTGGPDGDTGLTGRKIIVDTYGGAVPHGGGAFSGKDSTKVDRSAAYMARYMAKNVVAAGLADKCLIQLAYAIGVSYPVAMYVNTFNTGKVDEPTLQGALRQVFDCTPAGIIRTLGLRRPIFKVTASYGHFGRKAEEDGKFSWEKTDKTEDIKNAL